MVLVPRWKKKKLRSSKLIKNILKRNQSQRVKLIPQTALGILEPDALVTIYDEPGVGEPHRPW